MLQYVPPFREKTFVVAVDGAAVADENFVNILMDVAVLWSLGGFTPFYNLVYWIVPGAKFFRAPSTFFYLAQFAIAVFAAARSALQYAVPPATPSAGSRTVRR